MTKDDRDTLAGRYVEIGDELESLAVARGAHGTRTDVETALCAERDNIEQKLGADSERQDAK